MPRLLLVGFDGATLDLCERWIAEGRMPALASLMGDGAYGTLRSTLPDNSAVAWTSLSTGTNPGRHGIYDFVLPRTETYGYRVATGGDRRVPALWRYASEAGARVAVINIPITFPAEQVGGVMVSGMDAPRLDERAVHPEGLLEELRARHPDYQIMSKAFLAASRGDFDWAERELIDVMAARARFVADLSREGQWDLVMVNLEATDGAHHFFWQHHDDSHPRHDGVAAKRWGDSIGRVYEATDRELQRIIDAYGPDTVIVVSDHGGGPSSDWVLFMNDWLMEQGLLAVSGVGKRRARLARALYAQARKRLSVPARRMLRPLLGGAVSKAASAALYGGVDWTRSRAYAHMQPAVRVNLAGREPAGIVTERDRDVVVDEIAERASRLMLPDGSPVVVATHRVEDAYSGDAPGGPDLLFELAPGTEIRSRNTTGRAGFLHRLSDLNTYSPSGLHSPLGLVVAAGSGIARSGRAAESNILQVAPSVLALMGVPAPAADSSPLPFVDIPFLPTTTGPSGSNGHAAGLTLSEEEEVLERLRGLGYVD